MESREDLKAYLDGELNATQAEAVRLAAESDSEIRKELDELRLVGLTLSGMAKQYEVEGLERTLRALDGDVRVATVAAPKKRLTWYGVGVAIAAAVTLLYALPANFGQAKVAAKSSLASRRYVAADAPARMNMHGRAPTAGFLRPPRVQSPNGTAASPAAIKQPLSPQDQIKADQAKLKQLQDENSRLKAEQAATSKNLVPATGMALPAPMSPGDIVPGDTGLPGGAADSQGSLSAAKGVPPQKIAQLEAQVKKMAVGSGAKVESVSGPTVMRVLSLSIDSNKAAHLAEQIRGLLKASGSVTIETIAPAGESAIVQGARSKIVDLKLQKDRLLVDFLPEAPQVVELDRQIKILEASIKPDAMPPRSRLHVSIG